MPGNINATLTDIQPLNTITLGLGLGVWDTPTQVCTIQLQNSAAKLNVPTAANSTVAGELCVAVYDVGNISTDTITYTVTILHN